VISGNVKYQDKLNNIIITTDKAIYLKNEEKIFAIGNSKAVNENNTITAFNLEYDKIENIFEAKKNAVVIDFEKDTTIYADKISYFKDEEKISTKGKTRALVENKYEFNSENVSYFRSVGDLISERKSSVKDDSGNIYKLKNFTYNINKEMLKGKEVEVLAKIKENKIDQFFFSEGFFNFKDKSHLAKETKIKIHKEVFGDENQDPRIYGSSSLSDQNKTVINNGIFTSCKLNDNCPPWSIKAEKITHDKIKKDMIYKNAILKIYDVPILYFPKFFHPDPSVKRRSGFLQPQFNNSETLGSSLYIPYFKTLGPDKDLTIKPTFFEKLTKFEKEKYILQSELRKKNENSSLIADLAFLRDYKSSTDTKTKNINHFFLNYTSDLKSPNYLESKFDAQIEKVTNDTYLKVFQNNLFDTPVMPENQTTMNSNIKLYLEKEDQNLTTGIEVYENLGQIHSDRYQYTLPYYDFSKNFTSLIAKNSIDGSLSFYSTGTNKLSNTNNLRTTVANDINYSSKDFISSLGFKSNFDLFFKNLNAVGKNDSIYTSDVQIDGMSTLKLDTSLPLIKSKNTIKETLTPKVSLRINPGNNMDNYSGSLTNINVNNIFDINRLGLTNDFEAGKSLTLGLDYKLDLAESDQKQIDKLKDKYLELKLAMVIRDQNENDIPISSTINQKNSDLFGSIDNHIFENINFTYNFLLDNDMNTINSNEIETEISINNFITTFNFIEKRNEIGSTHLLSNVTEYKFDKNTSLKFSTRRNKEINLTEYYDLSYEYKNDCLTAALRFNKSFYQDNDLKPTEDLFFSITLIPLTTYEREIYKTTSGQDWLKGWFK
jgi:LPS-assembly protein